MNHNNPDLGFMSLFDGVCEVNVIFVEIIGIRSRFPTNGATIPFENQKRMLQLH